MSEPCNVCGFYHSKDVEDMYNGIDRCIITLQGKIGEAQTQFRYQARENERLLFENANLKAEVDRLNEEIAPKAQDTA